MRYSSRRKTPAPMPLFEWWANLHRQRRCPARLILRADLTDAEGEPRACIAEPGKPLRAFRNLTAALAALHEMEAAHVGR